MFGQGSLQISCTVEEKSKAFKNKDLFLFFTQGLIFRFKFLMLTTLLCAALTVIFFIISQVSEGQWKWGDDGISLEYSSAFLAGGKWFCWMFEKGLSLKSPYHSRQEDTLIKYIFLMNLLDYSRMKETKFRYDRDYVYRSQLKTQEKECYISITSVFSIF